MTNPNQTEVPDALTLRFVGEEADGNALHELRAEHVAKVLEGVAELTGDFEKAGAFHREDGIDDAEIMVRPAREGSFIIEVVRVVQENWDVATTLGVPSVGTIVWWATKSARAEVADFEDLGNGNVKVKWQDGTAQEIPRAAWEELNKRKTRRKKQLRKIMAPLEDPRVRELDASTPNGGQDGQDEESGDRFTLEMADYIAVRPDEEVEETFEIFDVEAQMATAAFEDPTQWRVKIGGKTRKVTVEDQHFLEEIAKGRQIGKDDLFRLQIREDRIKKAGRTTTRWTALIVETRRIGDDDST